MKNRRQLNRFILKFLPESSRYRILRKRVPRCTDSSSLVVKLAETEEELRCAYRLLHDSYVKAGFMNPHPTGMRVLAQHLLPQTSTVVAKCDGRVIGTLSLICDNPIGLPMERTFDLGSIRQKTSKLVEVSSLAIDPAFRVRVDQALFPLFRFVYHYGTRNLGAQSFVIAVGPSIVDLYRAFLLFDRIESETRPHGFVNGAPAVGLHAKLGELEGKWRKTFVERPDYVEWFNEIPKMPAQRSTGPVITPVLIERFARSITAFEFEALRKFYLQADYQVVFARLEAFASFARKKAQDDHSGISRAA